MLLISRRPGDRTRVRFLPGCLVWSLLLSIALTVLVNLVIRVI